MNETKYIPKEFYDKPILSYSKSDFVNKDSNKKDFVSKNEYINEKHNKQDVDESSPYLKFPPEYSESKSFNRPFNRFDDNKKYDNNSNSNSVNTSSLCTTMSSRIYKADKLERDDYSTHILENRYNIILKKILQSVQFLEAKMNRSYYPDAINYIDYVFYTSKEVRYNFSYVIKCISEEYHSHISNYSEYLSGFSLGTFYASMAIIKKINNNVYIETPNEMVLLDNNLNNINSIDNVNLLILLTLDNLSRRGYYIDNFKIYLAHFKNPVDITVYIGDIIFTLKDVTEYPIFFPIIKTDNVYPNKFNFFKYNHNNPDECNKAILYYNHFVTKYLNNCFNEAVFPLISKSENSPLHVYLEAFCYDIFKNIKTNICNFDLIIDEKKMRVNYNNCLDTIKDYGAVYLVGSDNILYIKLTPTHAYNVKNNSIEWINLSEASRIIDNSQLMETKKMMLPKIVNKNYVSYI